MDQTHTPLYNAILQHAKGDALSLHVPGHKNGMVFPKAERFRELLSLDLTELSGLDDLHSATGVIQEAQVLLSQLYQSDESWFLVGGSTVGNLAMICACCNRGDRVLVQRNSHRSVLNGIQLAGAKPVLMAPEIDRATGLSTAPSLDTVESALKEYPDARALILTYPNYYGMSFELKPLIELAHRHGIPVLVDEAHGAHFVLGEPFPEAALACGADAVVQSAHKTLPAMTMGAFLHVQGERIRHDAVANWLRFLQSSSPSYPIMASLDLARFYIAHLTESDQQEILEDARRVRKAIRSIQGLSIVGKDETSAYQAIDPLKVTLQVDRSYNGFELARLLEGEGIYSELADPRHVLLVLPLARFDETKLIRALQKSMNSIKRTEEETQLIFTDFPRISHPEWTEGEETARVPLEEAIGAVSAQEITPYPPGVPLIIRGERITQKQIQALRQWQGSGGRFQSGHDAGTKGIEVYVGSKSS